MLERTTIVRGALRSPAVREVINTDKKIDKKNLQRYTIQNEVFDLEDSVADNAKMIALLMKLCSRFYDTFTDTQKARLSAEDKTLIEYTFSKHLETETRGDVQLANEGTEMIDRVFDRQAQVSTIIN